MPEFSYPLIALQPDGDAFTLADIIPDAESSHVGPSPLPDNAVADLAYLRTPLEGITLADAESALAVLDPDMAMQPWIEVAAGLKHQFDSAEAYALWDTWSAKGKKYVDADETKYRWNSLRAQPTDRAPVTIRSLFRQAQARGWTNALLARRQHQMQLAWLVNPARTTEELFDHGAKRIAKVSPVLGQLEKKTLLVALKDAFVERGMAMSLADVKKAVRDIEVETLRTTGVPPWAKGLCFVTATNVFYRPTTDRQFTPEVIDLMHTIPGIGEEKPMRPRDYLIQVAGVPQVENRLYNPAMGGKRFFSVGEVPYVNTYRADYAAPEVDRADEAGAVFTDHMEKLIAEPEYRAILTSWLAYHVQHPGKKIRWAPLVQSAEGAGKTALAAVLKAILGRRNTAKLRASDVMEGQTNAWAYGKQVVAIEEVRIIGSNRHAVMDKLKPLITDDDIGLHVKFESHRTVENITNYLLFTNYQDALAVTEDSRRYFVVRSPLQKPADIARIGGKKHFDRLYAMIRDNPGGLRAWFEQWTFPKEFDPEGRAPVTPYLHELAENSASPLQLAVRDALVDGGHPLVRSDVLSLGCLRGVLDSTHLPDFSNQALAGVLRELGWDKYDRVTVDGAKHILYTYGRVENPHKLAEARVKLAEII